MARLLLLTATVLVAAELSSAASFGDSLKLDCGVSVWSEWGPTINGYRTRTRQVYQQPQNGGAECPNLSETDKDPWVPQKTAFKASTVQHYFLSGPGGSSSGRKRRQTVRDRDILFIVDSSGSIDRREFAIARTNLANLIGKICGTIGLGPQSNRAAVITYSTNTKEIFDFDDYDNLADVKDAILNMPRLARATCTGEALEYAKTMFVANKGARSDRDSVKEVVILTDGESNCGPDPVLKARELHNSRNPPLTIFAFVIGNFTPDGRKEIEEMVSTPKSAHLFHVQSFLEFQDMVRFVLRYPNPCPPLQFPGSG